MDIRCPCVTSKLDLFKGVGGVWWLVARGGGGRREGKREEERGREGKREELGGQSRQVDRGM